MKGRAEFLLEFILTGGSIIDDQLPPFEDEGDVLNLLSINEFDLKVQEQADRLLAIHNEAVSYLRSQLKLDLPKEIETPAKLTEVFLAASSSKNKKTKSLACGLLKVMNSINHIDGSELIHNCSISQKELFALAHDKVERQLSRMRVEGFPIVRYSGGRKSKESLVTRLLSKRNELAADINDRIRYHIITKNLTDIQDVILHLFSTLLPINYILPDESTNDLIPLPSFGGHVPISYEIGTCPPNNKKTGEQKYSGKDYRVVKFTVDLPVNLDRYRRLVPGPFSTAIGHITFCKVEFTIIDLETDLKNNEGENRHDRYKERQTAGVAKRILQS